MIDDNDLKLVNAVASLKEHLKAINVIATVDVKQDDKQIIVVVQDFCYIRKIPSAWDSFKVKYVITHK